MAVYSFSRFYNSMNMTENEFYDYAEKHHGLFLRPQSAIFNSLKDKSKNKGEVQYIIEPLFVEGEFVIMIAPPETGKSIVALDLSLAASSGMRFSSRLSTPIPCKTLYIDSEMNELRSKIRRDQFDCYYNSQVTEENFRIIFLRDMGKNIDLSNDQDQKWVEHEIEVFDPKLIVLDNLGQLIPLGSESNLKVVGQVFKWIDKILANKISILLVHHVTKDGTLRGSSKWADKAELVIRLNPPKEKVDNDLVIEFTFEKARYLYGEQKTPFTLRYETKGDAFKRTILHDDPEPHDSAHEPDKNYSKEFVVSPSEIDKHDLNDLMIEILSKARKSKEAGVKAGDFSRKSEKGRSRATVTNVLNELVTKSLITKEGVKKGTTYYAVDKTDVGTQLNNDGAGPKNLDTSSSE